MNSSLDLIYAQVATLTARIDSAQVKTRALKSSVDLIRSLGEGWDRGRLPNDEAIQPFEALHYRGIEKSASVGGLDVPAESNNINNDLTNSGRLL